MPTRKAHARWEGTFKEGRGNVDFGNGAFQGNYSYTSRFEEGPGTNPEEMIGAAHASCFSMALAGALEKAGFTATSLDVTAHVTVKPQTRGGFKITESRLACEAVVPGIDDAAFQEFAAAAKAGCPVSKALKGTAITLDAKLVSAAAEPAKGQAAPEELGDEIRPDAY